MGRICILELTWTVESSSATRSIEHVLILMHVCENVLITCVLKKKLLTCIAFLLQTVFKKGILEKMSSNPLRRSAWKQYTFTLNEHTLRYLNELTHEVGK